jgi:hypothetical protein
MRRGGAFLFVLFLFLRVSYLFGRCSAAAPRAAVPRGPLDEATPEELSPSSSTHMRRRVARRPSTLHLLLLATDGVCDVPLLHRQFFVPPGAARVGLILSRTHPWISISREARGGVLAFELPIALEP